MSLKKLTFIAGLILLTGRIAGAVTVTAPYYPLTGSLTTIYIKPAPSTMPLMYVTPSGAGRFVLLQVAAGCNYSGSTVGDLGSLVGLIGPGLRSPGIETVTVLPPSEKIYATAGGAGVVCSITGVLEP